MTRKDKLIKRIKSLPTDFTWHELNTLLLSLGYKSAKRGKTGGSRVKFVHAEYPPVLLHKPHPRPVLKAYQVRAILFMLKEEGLI